MNSFEMAGLGKTCSHTVPWEEDCAQCEIVWLERTIPQQERRLAKDKAELKVLQENLIQK